MAIDVAVEAAVGRPLKIVAVTATGVTCRVESSARAGRGPKTSARAGNACRTVQPARRHALRTAAFGGPNRRPADEPAAERAAAFRHAMVRDLEAAASLPAAPRDRGIGIGPVAGRTKRFGTDGNISSLVVPQPTSVDTLGATAGLSGSAGNTVGQANRGTRPFNSVEAREAEKATARRNCTSCVARLNNSMRFLLMGPAERHGRFPRYRGFRRGGANGPGGPCDDPVGRAASTGRGQPDAVRQLAACLPDGMLVRNLAGLAFCRREGIPAVADFSLNAVNDLTVDWLCNVQRWRVTAAYDLDDKRLLELASSVPAGLLEVIVHRHVPMFHSQYCLYGNLAGRNHGDCGRPCRRGALRLRDRYGEEHFVWADSQCRNTIFRGRAESLLELAPSLSECGVRHFRVELSPDDDCGRPAARSHRIGNGWRCGRPDFAERAASVRRRFDVTACGSGSGECRLGRA